MTQVESMTELDESEELLEMPSLEHGAIGILLGHYLELQRLLNEDELDGEDVIPGFKLKVSRLFEFLNIAQPDALE